MQNLQFSSGCGGKLYPIKCELWGEVTPRVRNSHQHLSGVGSSGPPPPHWVGIWCNRWGCHQWLVGGGEWEQFKSLSFCMLIQILENLKLLEDFLIGHIQKWMELNDYLHAGKNSCKLKGDWKVSGCAWSIMGVAQPVVIGFSFLCDKSLS